MRTNKATALVGLCFRARCGEDLSGLTRNYQASGGRPWYIHGVSGISSSKENTSMERLEECNLHSCAEIGAKNALEWLRRTKGRKVSCELRKRSPTTEAARQTVPAKRTDLAVKICINSSSDSAFGILLVASVLSNSV